MKKIIYSIATAFLLSVILTLLLPKLFFKGDAHWTYQNDTAREDVSFRGHLKNGHVGAVGTDQMIMQPAWLVDESYQGIMAEIPVSCRNKTYNFVLIGYHTPLRSRYYTGSKERFRDGANALLSFPYNLPGSPCISYEFYYPTHSRSKGFTSSHKNKPDYIARLRRLYRAEVLQKAEV